MIPQTEKFLSYKNQVPFYILGYDHGNFYFLPHDGHEIIILTLDEMVRENFLRLAHVEWWQAAFKGVDLSTICSDLMQACYAHGVFSECELFQNMLPRQRKMGWFI